MNEKEQSILDDLTNKLPEAHQIEIAMVYYSQIQKEMWVLYEKTLKEGRLLGSSASIKFHKDSRMVIHNIGWINANLIQEPIHAQVKHFQWDGNDFIEIEK